MQDQAQRELDPQVTGQQLLELGGDLLRIPVVGEPETPREPLDVGVDGDARGDAERLAKHDLRGLAADAGERGEGVEVPRHLATGVGHQLPRRGLQVAGLLAVEPHRPDDLFDVAGFGGGKLGRSRPPLEQRRRHLVDPHVGALRRQHGGHQQLPRRAVVELAQRLGVQLLEPLRDLHGTVPSGHGERVYVVR